MDTLGFEPRAFRMRSGCDTTTPCAHLHREHHFQPVNISDRMQHSLWLAAASRSLAVHTARSMKPHTRQSQ